MSSVLRPRIASAAARFTAVVVLPTPPFWFAMATIIGRRNVKRCAHYGYAVEVCQTLTRFEESFAGRAQCRPADITSCTWGVRRDPGFRAISGLCCRPGALS